ncbi:MAG: rRNA maturation RNase YbeY [Pseudomonadota bacterium]|nr:rRNA maturation RNase YbeY [Pseudomonadota bacterium]
MPVPALKIDIQIELKGWRKIPRLKARLDAAARTTMALLPQYRSMPLAVTLLLTGNAAIQRLNRDFRGLDKPTNILSFPQYEPAQLPKKSKAPEPVFIGDLAMAYQYMVGEAKKDNKILIDHIVHLFIHGILHLFGYHHASASAAARMEGLEKKVMAELGLPNPYAPRTPVTRKQ